MQIKHIKTLAEHPSSNKYIKENKSSNLEHTLVRVIDQTAGVGRRGTPWQSSANLDLTFSFYVVVDKQKQNQVFMATVIALHNVLNKYTIQSFTKLPNDIYVKDKKIAGILIESTHREHQEEIIVGVGLNVNEMNPASHDKEATSMFCEQNTHNLDLDSLLNEFIEQYNIVIKTTDIFDAFKKTIPFESLYATLEAVPYLVKSMDTNFNCLVEGNGKTFLTPCTNLTFKVKKNNK